MKNIFVVGLVVIAMQNVLAQNQGGWQRAPFHQEVFIENKGQFDGMDGEDESEILYAIDNGFKVYFTKQGLTWRFEIPDTANAGNEFGDEELDSQREYEMEEAYRQMKSSPVLIRMNWVGANPDAEIVVDDLVPEYFIFTDSRDLKTYSPLRGYRKLTYRNIYPGIDFVFTYHIADGKQGVKYSVIVRAGADPSKICMNYSGADLHLKQNGNLEVTNAKIDALEEFAPTAFQNGAIVGSAFHLSGNSVTFQIDQYSRERELIIDPFIVVPTGLLPDFKAFDVAHDGSGNIYVCGGTMNYKVSKYDPAGNLLWTYNTPMGLWTTWGDMAVDPAGNAYIQDGCGNPQQRIKLLPNGIPAWILSVPLYWEHFAIAFNCSSSQLVISGEGIGSGAGAIANVDPNTGVISNVFTVPGASSEIRSLAIAPDGQIFGHTCFTANITTSGCRLFCVNPNFTMSAFGIINTGFVWTEFGVQYGNGSTLFGPGGFQGQNGLAADNCYVYLSNGASVEKRDRTTGAVLASAIIPGGIPENNSGICVDACGNVYVGSQGGVYKFDPTLTSSTFSPTGGPVYCVTINNNNEVLASGQGFVASLALNACGENGCPVPAFLSFNATPAGCNSNNGSATVTVQNAPGPYSYSWSTGATTATITNLAPGAYTCTVTAACYTLVDTVNIPASVPPVATITAISNVSCAGGNDGAATVNISSGPSPFTYAWSPSGGNSATANNLAAGNYTCIVTDSAGCTASVTATITQPPAITAAISTTPSNCGDSTGTATVAPNGGNSPYSYLWNPTAQTGSSAANLAAGTYTCTVMDSTNCAQPFVVNISNSNGPSVSVISQQNVSCNGGNDGAASIGATGGSPPYSYTWLPSGGNGSSAANLSVGNYTCTVTDSAGCVQPVSIVISQPTAFTITTSTSPTACSSANGSASVSVSGATSPYYYQWSSGGSSSTESGLGAGTYSCVITDAAGCTTDTSVVVTQSQSPIASSMHSDVSCNGGSNGSATALINSGSGPFTYNWLPAGGTNATATGLSAGTYTCNVTDANGCNDTAVATITEPSAIVLTLFSTNISCNSANDGAAWANVNGGTSPYSFNWLPMSVSNDSVINLAAGTYSFIITDANGCSRVDSVSITEPQKLEVFVADSLVLCQGQSTTINYTVTGGTPAYTLTWTPGGPTISPNSTAFYSVVALDANGCSSVADSILVIVNPALAATVTGPISICIGSSVTLTASASGGDGNYSYTWSAGTTPSSGPVVNASPVTTTTYSVIVTDGCGSPADTSVSTVVVNQLPQPLFTSDEQAGCAPLCISFTNATSNTAACTWQFGDGGMDTTNCNVTWCYDVPGTYYPLLIVTDNNGCTGSTTANFVIDVYPSPLAGFYFTPQDATLLNPQINFVDQSQNSVQWQWSFDQSAVSTLQNPVYTYEDTGTFVVEQVVYNSFGCTDTAYMEVTIGLDATLYIPNAFTPNGDGLNDVFLPMGVGADEENYELLIFDRWGNLIFNSVTWGEGWDGTYEGKLCQQDVYVWRLTYVSSVKRQKRVYTGHVSLVR
jgi:gliding motility-associated-like protein